MQSQLREGGHTHRHSADLRLDVGQAVGQGNGEFPPQLKLFECTIQ